MSSTFNQLIRRIVSRSSHATGEDEGDGSVLSNRSIHFNHTQIDTTYPNNEISTAKYNFLTFIPKFLFEQFRRYANIFFLSIGLLQQIPGVSPTGRYVTIVPFLLILLITAIKELVEDFKRHKADRKINQTFVDVLNEQGQFSNKMWKDIRVGNILKIKNDKFFPADLILLSSSEPNGICYIETSNLDGETNLKIRSSHPVTRDINSSIALSKFNGQVQAEAPNRKLYEFKGNILANGSTPQPIGPNELLLRGARLRNTQWVYGFCVYTGHESKLLMNSTKAPLKRSTLDKETNTQIIFLFFILVFLALVSAIANVMLLKTDAKHTEYIGPEADAGFGKQFITFFILYNNLIPISLQVTLELVKVFQAMYINSDEKMHFVDENLGVDSYALARTSNLNEELGQIKYIFSDKTGTLTQNIMEYKKCSVAGVIYSLDEIDDASKPNLITNLDNKKDSSSATIEDYLILLAVCHTVIPEQARDGQINYNAASPDEKALVEAAAKYGYEFVAREPESVTIKTPNGREQVYIVLNVIEFTSSRKRMSVVVKTPSGRIKIYSKGADNVILDRLGVSIQQRKYYDITVQHLERFAKEGLRTLCLGVCSIPDQDYEQWNSIMQKAATSMENRDDLIEVAADKIERNLTLIGATAIEDKLQDKVPETIAKLLEANINVWMLTGDKQETAINIAKSCRLHKEDTEMIIINAKNLDEAKEEINEHISNFSQNNAIGHSNDVTLVLDGKSLEFTLTEELRNDFINVCTSCKAVVCCRVSPIQKAHMVELVKDHTKAISLSIGDGANDVAMIQKADVGVGISGNEGLQAANSADFAIGQFKFLERLLFVHGAWNYSRISKVILYSFYKNITLYIIELWFAVYNYWSGQVLYERWTIGMYNIFFTSAPPVALGLFDRTCSAETREKYPSLYKTSQSSEMFNHKQFWKWIMISLYHSALLFWLPMFSMNTSVIWDNGRTDGYLVLGNTVYTLVVITTCLKAGIEMDAWTWFSHGSIWGSIILWFLFLMVYSMFWPSIPLAANMSGMIILLMKSPVFWFSILVVPVITLLFDVGYRAYSTTVNPSEASKIRLVEMSQNDPSNYVSGCRAATENSRLLRNVSSTLNRTKKRRQEQEDLELNARRGYAYSQEEGGAVSQTDYIRSYDTRTRSQQKITPVSSMVSVQNL